ncbi:MULTISPECIES: MarR family winged helix-turn-helix transcriptional regulator [Virgibacillus]|uniref:HTH-type transcriptional regulator MhqR n=2 Tax=Virgibacillus TaxID=84406 RepID=A0A2K9IVX3_9BACI|nr:MULTISPECIES: MarR family transcriptional regulator [Virgibacillus]AUJ23887.1 HTH-type transcriptional regulator MhqR [Virgibacillus dokdonensis]NWO12342.1 MarR family transcriptional regulator [Virgibacillus sp.]SHH65429.1 MarR family transcriptional regulator, 2-MHQ and catechol-resistance regulon repressor [Virgibacillus chiguensis]
MKENLSLKAFVVLIKASKALQDYVMEDMKNYGMKTSEFTILETLYHKGKQTVREISESVLIKTGSITYVIDKLEEKGLLQRKHSQEDRRVVYIDITDKGKQLMDEIFPKHQQVIEELFMDVSDEQKKVVIDVLKKAGKRL